MLDAPRTFDNIITWISAHPQMGWDIGPWVLMSTGLISIAAIHWSSLRQIFGAVSHQSDGGAVTSATTQPHSSHPGEFSPSGKWIDTKFVCDEPVHVFTTVVTEKNNDMPQNFSVSFAPVGSLVEVVKDIDRQDELVKADVGWPRAQAFVPLELTTRQTRSALRLPDDRLLVLRTRAAPGASVTTIRIRVASWTVGKSSI